MVFPYEKGWTFHRAYAMAVRSGEVISWVDMSDIPARITRKSVRATAEFLERTGQLGSVYDKIIVTEHDTVWADVKLKDRWLEFAALVRAKFLHVELDEVFLARSFLGQSIWLDSRANFTTFRSAILADSIFQDCHFEQVNFLEAQLQRSVFANCEFIGCTFKLTNLQDTKIRNGYFHSCLVEDCKGGIAPFEDSRFLNVEWRNGPRPRGMCSFKEPFLYSWRVLEGGKAKGTRSPPPAPPLPSWEPPEGPRSAG